MKNIFLLLILGFSFTAKAQNSCAPSWTITDIYYPNSTSNYSVSGEPNDFFYLCGPNTVLYDTLYGCAFGFVNKGSTLFYKSSCSHSSVVYLRDSSTLNLLSGLDLLTVVKEPSAIIINPSGVPLNVITCSAIAFPVVNCSVGIEELETKVHLFKSFPNPVTDKIYLEIVGAISEPVNITIANQIGEVIYQQTYSLPGDTEISTDNLSNGSYFISLKTRIGEQTEKLIILK